ncbi:MAG: sugar ABC transporter permease [Alphaproteobacteria bacterium]|nr:sugar ABC transporter permease [Alphaproteobacteria bacterium]
MTGVLMRSLASPQMLLAPIMVALGLFYFGPIAFGMWASLQAESAAMTGGRFVGLEHYESLAHDPRFHASLWITVVFTLSTVLATYAVGLATALLLAQRFRGREIVGSALLIPWTMPLVVVAVVWGWLLDYQFGAVNYVLRQLGLIDRSVGFLTDPDLALWSVGIAQVWRMFPLAMVTLLAAIKAIPLELYEAAAIDGAGRWHAFRFVTLPGIRSTTAALMLLIGIWAFGRAFTIIFVMTGGGPAAATETLVIQTYVEAFRYFRLERASALGTIVLLLSTILTMLYLRLRRDQV